MKKEIEFQIINSIPSKYVRENLIKTEHEFDDESLVLLTGKYVKPFLKRLLIYDSLIEIISSDILKSYLRELVKLERRAYDRLCGTEEGFVYEIDMNTNSSFEKYLVPDFEACYEAIRTYLSCYRDFYESSEIYNTAIKKREVKRRAAGEDIDDNSRDIEAILNNDLEIIEIIDKENDIYDHYDVPDFNEISYPKLFQKYDLVRVVNPFDKKENNKYGIVTYEWEGEPACVCFLDNEFVRHRCIDKKGDNGYYPYFMCHSHIDYGMLELVDIENTDVEKPILEDYLYTRETVKKIMENE